MPFINYNGIQHRFDLIGPVSFYKVLIRAAEALEAPAAHTLQLKLTADRMERLVLPVCKLAHTGVYLCKLLRRTHLSLSVLFVIIKKLLIYQSAYSYHKEFIKIARIDRCKFKPLHYRYRAVLCFLQNSHIEFQPRQLTVVIYFLRHISNVLSGFIGRAILRYQTADKRYRRSAHRCTAAYRFQTGRKPFLCRNRY